MQDRQDRRVLRNRTALIDAAVRLVSERGTTALPVVDISDAADVSRQLVYIQFGDRDALLVAAATDLVERELIAAEAGDGNSSPHERLLAMARHFARHRPFYRAMLTGSCAFPMSRALNRLFGSLITTAGLREVFGDLDETTAEDLKDLVTGGTGAIVNDWVIEAEDPLVPEELSARLLRVTSAFTRTRASPTPPPGGHLG
ncbi:TetR/AcrR family transcriptional regulator [Streptomyces spongiae]|uniref:TetR/AcrR family transcriptional regulator n=1 Tax=Streptomyces spongiae TaxID=565072 RepID=A0A5N8XX55_9ACTN|nr:TetR/AcrR family transcriptional regulator [Streptomyces spongiae]MPY63852.1 TetR/AcrR family transcriptional regulator [Streptomyces spongiae]